MNYDAQLDIAINALHDEGRYRVFTDICRENGAFPHAVWTRPDGEKQDIFDGNVHDCLPPKRPVGLNSNTMIKMANDTANL